MNFDNPIITHPSNYKKLLSYQKAEAIYDITYYFCHKYLARNDRTVDQMIQAARSGKQNIVEGSAASTTSKETEIKLINVAKASLHELLIDYEDYLRTRNFRQWEFESVEMNAMRKLSRAHNDSEFYMHLISSRPPQTIANISLVLIKQTDYLLFKQLESLCKKFVEQGGMRERMFQARKEHREKQQGH